MEKSGNDWATKAKSRLNDLMNRISTFEERGGFSGAFQRSVAWFKAEQERMRREMSSQGPVAHLVEIRRAYARLEVPFGADLDEVRRAYRALMRKYHPDRHASDPERERVATEISQKLTVSYNVLVDYLSR